jgi:hypothetical protein
MCFLTWGRKNGTNDDKFLRWNCYYNWKLSLITDFLIEVFYTNSYIQSVVAKGLRDFFLRESTEVRNVVKHESCWQA